MNQNADKKSGSVADLQRTLKDLHGQIVLFNCAFAELTQSIKRMEELKSGKVKNGT